MPATCGGQQDQLATSGVLAQVLLRMVPEIGPKEGIFFLPGIWFLVIINSARAFWVGNRLEAKGRGCLVLLLTSHFGDAHHLYKCPYKRTIGSGEKSMPPTQKWGSSEAAHLLRSMALRGKKTVS